MPHHKILDACCGSRMFWHEKVWKTESRDVERRHQKRI